MSPEKATATAPTNIAFTKYMGNDKRGDALGERGRKMPEHGSISMCLDALHSTTTVEFSEELSEDSFVLDDEVVEHEARRVFDHIDRIRDLAGISLRARIASTNNFGKSRGLSSSASGFAALSLAGSRAAGLDLSVRDLSILARKGSGSASRSIPDGFVEWVAPEWNEDGSLKEDSYSHQLHSASHWDIADVVAVTRVPKKAVSTTSAHAQVHESRYRPARLEAMSGKIAECRRILAERDFDALGRLIEEEAMDLHLLFISSGIRYLKPETLRVIEEIESWRTDLGAYFTMNTGQDVHIICRGKDAEQVQERAAQIDCVDNVIINKPGNGARLVNEHLF